MTDEEAAPTPPEPEASNARARIETTRARRWDALPILYLIGFLALAGTLFYLYRHPPQAQLAQQAVGRVESLQGQLQDLHDQVAALQNRPPPAPAAAAPSPELAQLQQRVNELEQRPAPAPAPVDGASPAQLGELGRRVQTLEARNAPDLGPITARVDALEKRPQPDLGPINAKLDALATQGRDAAAQTAKRLDALETRLGAVEAQAKQTQAGLERITQRAERAARLQGAAAALAAGQRLGDIPGAPPALARFAHDAPPTEAGLRLSFDKYAEAAQRASQPAIMKNEDFGTRLWNRAQQVVTVRQGDRVLLGDPVAGVLAHAREAVDAGDLEGALKALGGLAGPAAEAMQPWTDQARALLEARAAIASMANG